MCQDGKWVINSCTMADTFCTDENRELTVKNNKREKVTKGIFPWAFCSLHAINLLIWENSDGHIIPRITMQSGGRILSRFAKQWHSSCTFVPLMMVLLSHNKTDISMFFCCFFWWSFFWCLFFFFSHKRQKNDHN